MNWDNIQGNWNDLKGKLKSTWGKLTDDDLDGIADKKDAWLGRLQERRGFAQDEAQLELDASHGFRSARSFVHDVPTQPKGH